MGRIPLSVVRGNVIHESVPALSVADRYRTRVSPHDLDFFRRSKQEAGCILTRIHSVHISQALFLTCWVLHVH